MIYYIDIDQFSNKELSSTFFFKSRLINKWKKQYNNIYITSITNDKHLIWRPLKRFEYFEIIKKIEQLVYSFDFSSSDINLFNEQIILKLCILHSPFSKDKYLSSMPELSSLVTQQILQASGFLTLERLK